MAKFLSHDLAQFAREMTFTPPDRRRRQIELAESLYWEIDPDRAYPLDFIVFRITGYRPDRTNNLLLTGQAVRRDLLALVDQVSGTLDDEASRYDPPAISLPEVCRRLSVSEKTISRYRRDGLFARRLPGPDGRRRLVFLPGSVQRFAASRGDRIEKAARFSRIDEPTRHRILMRARRISSRADVSPYRVAQHLSRKFGRSVESIRQLLLSHDERDPRVAIFPEHTPPLTDRQQRAIARAYHRGVAVTRLARHFNRARNAIYRAINRRRADALRDLEIRFIASPTFDLPDAEAVILHSAIPQIDGGDARSVLRAAHARSMPEGALAAYARDVSRRGTVDRDSEQRLFVRYNYLKYRAAAMRDTLDKYQPEAGKLDRIETCLRRAIAIKHTLAEANLRLVIGVAAKHAGGAGAARRGGEHRLLDLINSGNVVLLQAIDTFDVSQGNRFSTYLTYALMRSFARAEGDEPTEAALPAGGAFAVAHDGVYTARTGVGIDRALAAADDPSLTALETADYIDNALPRLLGSLAPRERFVIVRRFGLIDPDDAHKARAEPQTLGEVAAAMGVSDERVRQIEQRAVRKLRKASGAADRDSSTEAEPAADTPI